MERYSATAIAADADQIRADDVEVVNQRVGDDAAQQAFGWNDALPVNGPRQQTNEPRKKCDERDGADRLGVRRADGPRAKPVQRVHHQKGGNQEHRDAEDLQREVGDAYAPATPIQLCAGRPGSGVAAVFSEGSSGE